MSTTTPRGLFRLALAGLVMVSATEAASCRIDVEGSNVRARPDTGSPVLFKATKGTLYATGGRSGDWYPLDLPSGQRGFVHHSLVSPLAGAPGASPPLDPPSGATPARPAGPVADKPSRPAAEPVDLRCDRFRVDWIASVDSVMLAFNTDLPDRTEIEVSISRSYRRKGDPAEHVIDYFRKRVLVGRWRNFTRIHLDDRRWFETLERQRTPPDAGQPTFEMDRIERMVELRAMVPGLQPGATGGHQPVKLTGRAIRSLAGRDGVQTLVRFPMNLRGELARLVPDPGAPGPGPDAAGFWGR